MINYQGKQVVIVGLGVTGLSCVDYFMAQGVIPRVIDTRQTPTGLDKLPSEVERHLGSLNEQWLMAADLIVVSPGIALSKPELHQAAQAGIEIVGDIELFCREVNAKNTVPIIAITGANGKTTVTTLVGDMIKAANKKVGIGGNIGQPALTLLNEDCEFYVLELSSFQLETTSSLQATVATILNLTEDHMDRYPSGLKQYRAAKLRIYDHAKVCVVNAEDPLTFPENGLDDRCVDFGIYRGKYHLEQGWLAVQSEKIINTESMQLTGLHNYSNGLAALALVDAINIPRQASLSALKEFTGLAHRFQLVYENNGVRWINDSKATNVGSTEAALKGLIQPGMVYLLLGGEGKSADFSPLTPYLQNNKIVVYCFGRDGQQLAKLNPAISTYVETMEQAMQQIAKQVKEGDLVLLSPACASLDQFRNYEQRGDEFSRLAKELG